MIFGLFLALFFFLTFRMIIKIYFYFFNSKLTNKVASR
ncbi:unnamed protein product [Larinioides sclopetarius]|uniref:ATP synthase F0 subunit 8 n=1 Tax=Larinioides sclopetarius TaxID=280406 RepID=A0AAV1Z0X9_9ARAC